MGRKKKLVNDQDLWKAREVVRRFGELAPSNMNKRDQRALISVWYSNIHGKPINQLGDNQLYRVCDKLYRQSYELVEVERTILENIEQLKTTSKDERDKLDERVCIQLEANAIVPNSHLVEKYEQARDYVELPF